MKNFISAFICCLMFVFSSAQAQNFKKQYNELVSKKDEEGIELLLQQWEKAEPNNAELYVAFFNFYVNKSVKSSIELGNNPKGKEALVVLDNDTSKKEPYGYIYENPEYDSALLKKGFEYADLGIQKNPARLDIRFGKVYMFGELESWNDFTSEIIKTINYSIEIKNKWLWTDNKPVEDPQEFMLSSIQSYQKQLYDTENDDVLDDMKLIAETVLKYYPDHVESLSNLAVIFLIREDYDKALEVLLKAEKLDPKDFIVLGNLAHTYKLKNDKPNAIKYYELMLKHGDNDAKQFAREQIDELNEN